MPSFVQAISMLSFALASHQALAANCDASSFGVLANSPLVGSCMRDSDVPMLALPAPATEEQLAKICATLACRQMLKILLSLNPVECNIPLGSRIRLRGDLMDPAVTYCASHDQDVAAVSEIESSSNSSDTTDDNDTIQFPAVRTPSSDAQQGRRQLMCLFSVGHDALHPLSAMLNDSDLEALTSVATRARQSLFQAARDARSVLLLPPMDQHRARALLCTISPSRLVRFKWIQVQSPWHVDLLVELELQDLIHSVRVVGLTVVSPSEHTHDVDAATSMCEKLTLWTGLVRLHVVDDVLKNVKPLSRLLQLRELDVGRTTATDVSSLSALRNLESLAIKFFS